MRQRFLKQFWSLSILVAASTLLSSGCSEAKKAIDDATSTVTGESKEPAPVDGNSNTSPPQPPAPPQPPPPAPPSPEELFAEFQQLKPEQVTDGALARITSSPEAAAMVTQVDINADQGVSGTGLKQLTTMKNLASLTLRSTALRAEDLMNLADVVSLKELKLSSTKTNDDVVGRLASLPSLESLDVSGTTVSPLAAGAFSQMKHLTSLTLRKTQADDNTVAALAGLPIVELDLAQTRITNVSLPILLKMPALESLNVATTAVTGVGFKGFGRSDLKKLVVADTNFGIDGFIAIRGMKSLEELNVYRSGLVEHTKADVFGTFPKLRILNASNNAVTNAGMDVFFKGLKNLEELDVSYNTGITDQGLAALIAAKSLKVLTVHHTGCGPQGALALKQRLPDCTIITSEGTF